MGVDLFFVLSGLLITCLLVGEWDTTQAISFRFFYRRRALRLLPALAAMLAVFLLCTHDVTGTAIAAGYVSNFFQATSSKLFNPALTHLWSLAEEEQFYLLWPPVLFLFLRRRTPPRRIFMFLLGAVAVVFVERVSLALTGASAARMEYAPDTHADSILIGCAAGLAWTYKLVRVPAAIAFAALAPIALLLAFVTIKHDYPYAALPAFPLASAVVMIAVLDRRNSIAYQALSWPPLRFLGRISYGLYLWHFPIYQWSGPVVGLPLSIIVACLSYRYVETPFLRRKHRPRAHVRSAPSAAPA